MCRYEIDCLDSLSGLDFCSLIIWIQNKSPKYLMRSQKKVESFKLKKHWQMIAYVFQKYPENFAFQPFLICSNLPLKFAIFLKRSLIFTVSSAFPVYKKNLRLNNLKTRTAINEKISVFIICIEAIILFVII